MSVPLSYCRACGSELEPDAAFCGACGQAVIAAPQIPAPPPPPVLPPPNVPGLAAAPPRAGHGAGWGLLALGLVVGIVLGAVVFIAVSYFMPVRNIANIIQDTPAAQPSQPSAAQQPGAGGPAAARTGTPPAAPTAGTAAESSVDTATQEQVTPAYDRFDARQVMAYMVYAIFEQQPWMLSELVGPAGCAFAPYATEAETPGAHNGEEIAIETEAALANADATCLGYSVVANGYPDKAMVYWLGLNYDWERLHLGEYAAPTTVFEFYMGHSGWELVFIAPVPDVLVPGGEELLPPPLDFLPAD